MYFLKVGSWSVMKVFRLCLLLPASRLIYLSVSTGMSGSSRTLLPWWLWESSDALSPSSIWLCCIITWTRFGATSLLGVTSNPGNSTDCFLTIALRCSVKQHSAHGPITSQYSRPNAHFEWRSVNFECILFRLIRWESKPPQAVHLGWCERLFTFFVSLMVSRVRVSLGLSLCLCQYWIPPEILSEYVWKRSFSLVLTCDDVGIHSLPFPEERWSSTSFGSVERWKHCLWGMLSTRFWYYHLVVCHHYSDYNWIGLLDKSPRVLKALFQPLLHRRVIKLANTSSERWPHRAFPYFLAFLVY